MHNGGTDRIGTMLLGTVKRVGFGAAVLFTKKLVNPTLFPTNRNGDHRTNAADPACERPPDSVDPKFMVAEQRQQ
jgi:hypothetical protein